MKRYDLVVAGCGSGGFGAALTAARQGLRVLVIERGSVPGGTSTLGGVNTWEMSVGGTGVPFDLYRRLKTVPRAVGIYRNSRHICWPEDGYFPGGENLLDPSLRYIDTLLRHAEGAHTFADKEWIRRHWHGVPFDPHIMARVMEEMLTETGNVDFLPDTAIADAEARGSHVESVTLSDGQRIEADTFIDATGDGVLCSMCGCEMMFGRDPRSRFHEPAAPESPDGALNGVTLIFGIRRKDTPAVDPAPPDIPDACWWRSEFPVAAVTELPSGNLNINMLPTMNGEEFAALPRAAAYEECRRRALAFWHHYQRKFPEWQRYRIAWFAPEPGVRESHRIMTEYVLTQHDLEAGLAGQTHSDIIAINDHPMDMHGSDTPGCRGVESAYGIPYRCLIPKGFGNLLVACRAAGMSSLATSSCRLSRTMMQLGQAAGTAAALAKRKGCDLPDVTPEVLREALREQHVELEYPRSAEMTAYLSEE